MAGDSLESIKLRQICDKQAMRKKVIKKERIRELQILIYQYLIEKDYERRGRGQGNKRG